jgi:hypothetical protein
MKLSLQTLVVLLCVILGVAFGKGGKTGINAKLSKHGVVSSMQKSISGMTKSGLSHDNIVKNIQAHYPSKSKSEINDIVVASNIATNTNQARGVTNKKRRNGKR